MGISYRPGSESGGSPSTPTQKYTDVFADVAAAAAVTRTTGIECRVVSLGSKEFVYVAGDTSIIDDINVLSANGGDDRWLAYPTTDILTQNIHETPKVADNIPIPSQYQSLIGCAWEYGGKIYKYGGADPDTYSVVTNFVCYDPKLNIWTSLPTGPTALFMASVVVVGTKAYFIMAVDGSMASVDDTIIYDHATGNWSTGTVCPTSRYINTGFVSVYGGKIYLFGGTDNGNTYAPINTLDIYDPDTNIWSAGATGGPFGLFFNTIVSGDRWYFSGGEDDSIVPVPLDGLYYYDFVAHTWHTGRSGGDNNNTGREHSFVFDKDGKLYFVGGADVGVSAVMLSTVDIYDEDTNTWTDIDINTPVTNGMMVAAAYYNDVWYNISIYTYTVPDMSIMQRICLTSEAYTDAQIATKADKNIFVDVAAARAATRTTGIECRILSLGSAEFVYVEGDTSTIDDTTVIGAGTYADREYADRWLLYPSSSGAGLTVVADNTAAALLPESSGPIFVEENATTYLGASEVTIVDYDTADGTSVIPASDGFWVAISGRYASVVSIPGNTTLDKGQAFVDYKTQLLLKLQNGWVPIAPAKYAAVEGGEEILSGVLCYQDPTTGLAYVATNNDTTQKATVFGVLVGPENYGDFVINQDSYVGIYEILDNGVPTGTFETGTFLLLGDTDLITDGLDYGPVYLGVAGAVTTTLPETPANVVCVGQRTESGYVFLMQCKQDG
jgi:hypothetical protein